MRLYGLLGYHATKSQLCGTYSWKRLVHNGPFSYRFPPPLHPSCLTVLISCCKIHAILYEKGKGNGEAGGERREGIEWMNRVRDIYICNMCVKPYQHDPHKVRQYASLVSPIFVSPSHKVKKLRKGVHQTTLLHDGVCSNNWL